MITTLEKDRQVMVLQEVVVLVEVVPPEEEILAVEEAVKRILEEVSVVEAEESLNDYLKYTLLNI